MNNYPLLSIVTVVYNSEKYLEKTVKSVINQTYDNIEYIIIDGDSSDDTLKIIKSYEKYINRWMSEPDKGIYDAMNKGVNNASAEWVIFMNAGDVFYDDFVLEKIEKYLITSNDVCYGSVVKNIHGFDILESPGSLDSLWKGMVFSHQSCFLKRSILLKYPFDVNLKVAADFKQIFYIYSNNHIFREIELIISTISADGVSDRRRLRSTLERFNVVLTKTRNIKVVLYYYCLFIKEIIVLIVKSILPQQLNNYFYKLKYSKKNKDMVKE